jgi:hypothetical protein
LVIGLLAGCRRDNQIQTYTAPKEPAPPPSAPQNPASSGMPMMGADATPVPVNSTPLHWTTPASWQKLAPTSIRLGNLVVPGPGDKKAEVTITSFPGDVGGTLANVNRWRHEVGLGDVAEKEITSEKAVVDSNEGKLFEFAGPSERTVVAMIPRDGASWFFKMRGDSDVVAGAKPAFLEFLKSVQLALARRPSRRPIRTRAWPAWPAWAWARAWPRPAVPMANQNGTPRPTGRKPLPAPW